MKNPTNSPIKSPTNNPTIKPTRYPSKMPKKSPTYDPTKSPTTPNNGNTAVAASVGVLIPLLICVDINIFMFIWYNNATIKFKMLGDKSNENKGAITTNHQSIML